MTRRSFARTLGLTIGFICTAASPAFANQGRTQDWCDYDDVPLANEVFLFAGTDYTGPCQTLYFDSASRTVPDHGNCDPSDGCVNLDAWTCFDTTTSGLWNDEARSVRVGSEARVYLFRHSFNQKENGTPLILEPNTDVPSLDWYPGYIDSISAARVVDATRFNANCTQNAAGGIVLYSDANQRGDCVLLYSALEHRTPISMCFHNDTASSYANWRARSVNCYEHVNLGGRAIPLNPGTGNFSSFFVHNDVISSCKAY